MPKRGPKCKIGYHRLFNLILWVLYTGMQWKSLPVPQDHRGQAQIHYTTVYKARLLLRFEHQQRRHYGMKLMAYTLINLRRFCAI